MQPSLERLASLQVFNYGRCNVRFGSSADVRAFESDVGFALESGHFNRNPESPLWALNGHIRKLRQQPPKGDLSLHAGQLTTKAIVNAVTKRQVRTGIARKVQAAAAHR